MGKALTIILSAICLLAFVGSSAHAFIEARSQTNFRINGWVYCDTCGTKFQTRVSYGLEGAEMKLVCKDRKSGAETLAMGRVTTDNHGQYSFSIDTSHRDDDCVVSVVGSPDPKCNEIVPELSSGRATELLDGAFGYHSHGVKNLAFKAKEVHPDCKAVLKEMGM